MYWSVIHFFESLFKEFEFLEISCICQTWYQSYYEVLSLVIEILNWCCHMHERIYGFLFFYGFYEICVPLHLEKWFQLETCFCFVEKGFYFHKIRLFYNIQIYTIYDYTLKKNSHILSYFSMFFILFLVCYLFNLCILFATQSMKT